MRNEWSAFLACVEPTQDPDAVASLIRDGERLPTRALARLEYSRREVYALEFDAARPLVERNTVCQQVQLDHPGFEDPFVAITGRLVSEQVARLQPTIKRVTFLPSCHLGTYVAHTHDGDTMARLSEALARLA